MASDNAAVHPLADAGLIPAPIHPVTSDTPLRIYVLARSEPDPAGGRFVLLREMAEARVYLGAVCDAEGRVQEFVELWIQSLELRDLASGSTDRLTNLALDKRWQTDQQLFLENVPDRVIVTGMETSHARPVLIKQRTGATASGFALTEPAS